MDIINFEDFGLQQESQNILLWYLELWMNHLLSFRYQWALESLVS